MLRTYRIGALLGFPLEVNLSFLILLGVVLLSAGGLAGVFITLLAFGSVVLHELGHALMARHLGIRIAGIELQFFGGAAKMIDPPRSAGDEIAIAAAKAHERIVAHIDGKSIKREIYVPGKIVNIKNGRNPTVNLPL